jgi:serine/threonine protein phosphatase 1
MRAPNSTGAYFVLSMATYAISDIHGRIAELNHLLDYIALGEQDTVVFLGDYIDRGPDSKAVIERLLELEASHSNTHFRSNSGR